MDQKLKGVIVFYINFLKENDARNQEQTMTAIRNLNQTWIDQVDKDGEYCIMLIPTIGEASRVEKVDFESPFPRFVPRSMINLSKTKEKEQEEKLKLSKQEQQ